MNIITLLEEDQPHESVDVQALITAIQGASEFFKTRKRDDSWLYRGMDASMVPAYGFTRTYETRLNRRPKDSNPTLSDVLDKRLEQDFGIPYRSASLFTIGTKMSAMDYGTVGIILPQGPFKFCYGLKCTDAYKKFNVAHAYDYIIERGGEDLPGIERLRRSNRTRKSEEEFFEAAWESHEAKSLFFEWFDITYQNCEYRDTDLDRGLMGNREVMVHCKSYTVVPQRSLVARWHIDAAEELIGARLDIEDHNGCSIEDFITALSKIVIR